MIQELQQLATAVSNQTQLTESIKDRLDRLEVGGGGGPVGPIYAVNVIYDNTTSGTDVTNVQASLDEIYALIGDVNTVLGNIL